MVEVGRESTAEQIDAYWRDAMAFRMSESEEAVRLGHCGLGFYFKHLKFVESNNETSEHATFLDFISDDKRPFGNKNKAASVIFNLGWDVQRVLVFSSAPKWVEDEALKIYEALKTLLRKAAETNNDPAMSWDF